MTHRARLLGHRRPLWLPRDLRAPWRRARALDRLAAVTGGRK